MQQIAFGAGEEGPWWNLSSGSCGPKADRAREYALSFARHEAGANLRAYAAELEAQADALEKGQTNGASVGTSQHPVCFRDHLLSDSQVYERAVGNAVSSADANVGQIACAASSSIRAVS